MSDTSDIRTPASLLLRLRGQPADDGAWNEFVRHYQPLLMSWCRRWGLQDADAGDVTQNVLARLAAKMRSFKYDPGRRFRGWLRTLAHNAWYDFRQGQQRSEQGSGDSHVQRLLDAVEARDDLAARLEEAYDLELLAEAVRRVRERVAPQTWAAFHLTAVEGLSGAEAAERIPMRVAQVYIARRRVQEMLRQEVARLDGPVAGPEELPCTAAHPPPNSTNC